MMKACGSVYYVGENVQADNVWKSIKSTTDDAFLSGLCSPIQGTSSLTLEILLLTRWTVIPCA